MTSTSSGNNLLNSGVLIASADEALRGRLAAAIASLGIHAGEAASPAELSEELRRAPYRVALVDADGVGDNVGDWLSEIRRSHPGLVVLAAATEPTRRLLLELIHTKIYDFFAKPISTARLCETVRFLCASDRDNPAAAEPGEMSNTKDNRDRAELSREIFRTNQELEALNKMLKRQASQLTILYQMGRDISENENWSDALDRFLMALVNYIRAEGAALLLFSERESRLSIRSNFQVDPPILTQSCQVLLQNWKDNPRGSEIHAIESYRDMVFNACLDRRRPWRFTIIPLKHRSLSLGFLFIDKLYGSGHAFKIDYNFLNTLQTILAEEVANASYISELRQLSRFNHKVLDNIKSGVITTSLDGHVCFYNQQAAAMCPQLTGSGTIHFNRLFQSDAFGKEFYKKILRSVKDTHVLNVTCGGESNQRFPARLSITKMHDDNLNGTVLVAIFENLTEQKQLEGEIRRNDRLRVLGQLSAGVAHEIRNPLTGIATTAEVLGSKVQGEPDKSKYVHVILEETNRLNEIIRNLLNFARPPKPQIRSFALTELSQRVTGLLADEARKTGIALAVENRLKYDTCSADLNQLTQVLLNIVLNSIQACRRGDSVKIVLENEEANESATGAFARIDVIDNGEGVPPEVRSNLFEPFVTTKTHGTGLGLAISHQIIEEHDGRISCEFLKQGTRFSIRLPIEAKTESIDGRTT
jgi:nitrogen-specific signal transduction histidine kinase/DNA-binding response OmpR family regulator